MHDIRNDWHTMDMVMNKVTWKESGIQPSNELIITS